MAEKNSLWKNIRNKAKQNRRTGAKPKKPTAEMLRQERKIKAQYAVGGYIDGDKDKKTKRIIYVDPTTLEGKERYNSYRDSLDVFNNSLNFTRLYPNLPEVNKEKFDEIENKDLNLDRWSVDDYRYKQDKKNNTVKPLSDYVYSRKKGEKDPIFEAQIERDKALDKNVYTNNIEDFQEVLPDGSIKYPWGVTNGKPTWFMYTVENPYTNTTRFYSNEYWKHKNKKGDLKKDRLLDIASPNIKPIGKKYYASDKLQDDGEINFSSIKTKEGSNIPNTQIKNSKKWKNYKYDYESQDIYKKPEEEVRFINSKNVNETTIPTRKLLQLNKLPYKSYIDSNQQPGLVGNIENIQPSKINMDNFYEGQYEKYKRSPYEDPMYRVWVPGQQMQIVPEEQFKKLNDQYALKDLEQKAQGGPMEYKVGGQIPQKAGSTLYGIAGTGLNALTFGATKGIVDQGYNALQKAANPDFDPTNPNDLNALENINKFRGIGQGIGAVGTALTGNFAGAAAGFGEGVNTFVQNTDASDDIKKGAGALSSIGSFGYGVSKIGSGPEGLEAINKIAPFANQAIGSFGGQSLAEKGQDTQDYLQSAAYLNSKAKSNQQYVNQGLSFAASGGNINNNSLNLQTDSMRNRYKKYKSGGSTNKFGVNFIPDDAGIHDENSYGGVPIGPQSLAEGGEAVIYDNQGSPSYVMPDQVNGVDNMKDFTITSNGKIKYSKETLAKAMERKLNKLRGDSISEHTANQIKNEYISKRETLAQINAIEDTKKTVMEEYVAAYGGKLPNKYKGKVNMPSVKAKGGPTDPPDKFNSFWRKSDSTQYAQRGLRNDIMDVATKGIYDDIGSIESARKFGYNPSYQEIDNYYKDYGKTEKGKFEKARVEGQAGALKDYQNNKYLSLTNQDVIDLAERVIDNNGSYNFDNSSSHWDNKVDLTKTLNKLDLNRVKSMVDFKIKNKSTGGNIYAQGGPMVSNIKQPFEVAAQNRGGMMMARGGKMRYDGGGTFGPITETEAIAQGYQPPFQDEIDYTQIPDINYTRSPIESINPINFLQDLQIQGIVGNNQDMPMYYSQPSDFNAEDIEIPFINPIDFGSDLDYKDGKYNIKPKGMPSKITGDIQPMPSVSKSELTTPWYEEPWYNTAAGVGQIIPSLNAMREFDKMSKRKLTPEKISPSKVNLERSRITSKEEGRRALDSGLRTIRGGSSNTGQLAGNTRDTILNYIKNMGANIAKSYETEENTNAQLEQQAALANQQYGNTFKQLNEEIFQAGREGFIDASQQAASIGSQNVKSLNRLRNQRMQIANMDTDDYIMITDPETGLPARAFKSSDGTYKILT